MGCVSFKRAQGAGACPKVGAQKRPASSLPPQEMGEEGALYTLELAAEDALEQPGGVRFAVLFKQLAHLTPAWCRGPWRRAPDPR